jgi:hypothetical protein
VVVVARNDADAVFVGRDRWLSAEGAVALEFARTHRNRLGVGPREDRCHHLDPCVGEPIPVIGPLNEVPAEFVEVIANRPESRTPTRRRRSANPMSASPVVRWWALSSRRMSMRNGSLSAENVSAGPDRRSFRSSDPRSSVSTSAVAPSSGSVTVFTPFEGAISAFDDASGRLGKKSVESRDRVPPENHVSASSRSPTGVYVRCRSSSRRTASRTVTSKTIGSPFVSLTGK